MYKGPHVHYLFYHDPDCESARVIFDDAHITVNIRTLDHAVEPFLPPIISCSLLEHNVARSNNLAHVTGISPQLLT